MTTICSFPLCETVEAVPVDKPLRFRSDGISIPEAHREMLENLRRPAERPRRIAFALIVAGKGA